MDNRKLAFLLIILVVVLVTVFGLVWWISSQNQAQSVKTTPITNYDDTVKNLTDGRKTEITGALYAIIELNNKDIDVTTINDAIIREGSNKQVSGNSKYSGEFIVDIASIKQSYRILYFYSAKDDGSDTGYPLSALCLDSSELIYGDFECKNLTYWEESGDDLFKKLPYKGRYYTITGTEKDSKKTIVTKIMVNTNSTRTMAHFNTYKAEATQWLISQGANLDEYTLEWRNLSNRVVSDQPETSHPEGHYD